jgi:hypothetical protein
MDISSFDALMKLPVEALEEQTGAQLLEGSFGMKPPDVKAKRAEARNWWRSHARNLCDLICHNDLLRNGLFGQSERDRNAAAGMIADLLMKQLTRQSVDFPVFSLLALTCQYGMDKLCGASQGGIRNAPKL